MFPRAIVVASFLLVAACAADSSEPKTADQEKPAKTEEGPKRLAVTRALLEDNQLGPEDLARLQLYSKGRIVLRRESGAGSREITQQHTLKVVDGKTIEEVVVETNTPGVSIGTAGLLVNFDPEDPTSGFAFDLDEEGRFLLHSDASEDGPPTVEYGEQTYELVTGQRARLEIEAEKLRDYVTEQRKLPGTKLP